MEGCFWTKACPCPRAGQLQWGKRLARRWNYGGERHPSTRLTESLGANLRMTHELPLLSGHNVRCNNSMTSIPSHAALSRLSRYFPTGRYGTNLPPRTRSSVYSISRNAKFANSGEMDATIGRRSVALPWQLCPASPILRAPRFPETTSEEGRTCCYRNRG